MISFFYGSGFLFSEAALEVLQHLTFCKTVFRIWVELNCVTMALSQTLLREELSVKSKKSIEITLKVCDVSINLASSLVLF